MRQRRPSEPWERGPAAWQIKLDADAIRDRLGDEKRNFFSLRRAARLLGVSTQPVRDWIRRGHLKREGPRGQIARAELEQFFGWLEEWAEPFHPDNYSKRFPSTHLFQKLGRVSFAWPKSRKALSPTELAALTGCHPSLIRKGIRCGRLRGRRRSPGRWEVTRHVWFNSVP